MSSPRRHVFIAMATVVAFLVAVLPPPVAHADPLPADYDGSTHGDVLSLALTADGVGVDMDGIIGHSSTLTDSNLDPRAHAESANLHVGALGIPVSIVSDEANADNDTPSDTYDAALGEVDVLPVLDTGILTGTGSVQWAGDAACVADGTPIAQSTTSMAGATVGLTLAGVGVEILDVGTVETTGQTTLQAGSVLSTSSGNIASLSLINDLVTVEVLSNPELTATSDGTTGTVTANAYSIAVTIAGTTTELEAGGSIPIELDVGGVLSTDLTLSVGQVADTSSGATAEGSMTFLSLAGTIDGILGPLASVDVGLLPLSATATAGPGGVECDVLDPPVITSPTDGSTTGETPTIAGTGIPGATVTVTEGGVVIGTAVVGDGTWSLVPAAPFDPGDHTIVASQELGTAVSGPSDPVTFTVEDTTAPDAPVITSPTDGEVVDTATPTISGTGEPGATVDVVIDGTPVGTAVEDGAGNWSLPLTDPLAEGPHTATATQTDAAGNASPSSDPVGFTVDTVAPDAPVVTGPVDGSTIGDDTPTITGTGEPGATVEVTVDGAVVGTAVVDGDGNWFLPLTDPLADGDHTVTATQTDAAGNVSPVSAPSTFTVDTTAEAPVITEPESGASTTDSTPTIAGTGEPGSTVTVTDGDGLELGTALVDGAGNWSFDSVALADGTYTITATQEDAGGNVSPESGPVVFTVDTVAPDPPVITSPTDGELVDTATPTIAGTGEPGATVDVLVDGASVGTAVADAEGNWSLPLTDPLIEGPHTVTAIQTDPAGNASLESDPVGFTVDTVAPDAPVITSPTDGEVTNDPTPTISGTGEPGATVDVLVDGVSVGTAVVDGDGNWTLPDVPLDDGTYTVTATQTDAAGNVSPESDPVGFTVDTVAPDAPVITSPTDGEVVNTATPTITGTGEPGATVDVVIDGVSVGTPVVDAGGDWSLPLTDPLADGAHTVTATQTDAAGNVSAESDPVGFAVDTVAPDPPVITSPVDGEVTNDATPTIAGTGEPGATVEVLVDGASVGTALVDPEGNWSLELTDPLDDGEHGVLATQVDEAGNTSGLSDPVTFTVDTVAPLAPVITGPDDGSTTADSTPTITGTGEPGATVEVTIDGAVVGTAVVDGDGNWFLELTDPLAEGAHTVTATQSDEAGNVSPESSPVIFTVDATAPDAPVIASPTDGEAVGTATPTITGTGEPGATVEVVVDGTPVGTAVVDGDGQWTLELTDPLADGDHTVTATQADAAGNVSPESDPVTFTVDTAADAPVITEPVSGTSTTDSTPTIAGTGEPGSTVTVTDADGLELGTALVDGAGNWSFDSVALADGTYTITATQEDPAGNVSPESSPVVFTVDTVAPNAPVITGPTDGESVDTATPSITGTGEPGATVDVLVDGVPVGTAVVDAEGNWSLPLTDPLAEGPHTVTAIQADPAGNVSPESDPVAFTVDTVAPDAPVITSPTDGDLTTDSTPTISGTGEPGATIEVTVDGEPVGTVVVDGDGNWTLELADPLDDGEHTIVATQTDEAGNTSDESDPVVVTVDTTPPDPPTITGPVDGEETSDPTPTITGTGEPGATVEVTVDGEPVGTVVVDDGNWSLELTEPLDDGSHTITAVQTDAAGNTSGPADEVVFTVDTAAGVTPVVSPQISSSAGAAGDDVAVASGQLAATGSPVDVRLFTLLGVLVLGAGLLLVRRRDRG